MNKDLSDIRYSEHYKIRSSEIDVDSVATPLAILHLMQEASMGSAVQLGVSVHELKPLNLAWVLLRKSFVIVQLPQLGQEVRVVTYPANFDRILAYRDYKMYDLHGQLLAYASSTWTLLNLIDRKMVRLPSHLKSLRLNPEEKVLDIPPSRLGVIQKVISTEQIKVRLYDLDWNRHVNNLTYVKYILENRPVSFRDKRLIKIDFHIRAEAFLDDQIVLEYGLISDNMLELGHKLVLVSSDKIVAIANTYWT